MLSVATFASGISLRVTDPLLPRLSREFAVSLGDASWVITCFSVAYGLSQLMFGPLGDRFGKYRVIAFACSACAITALLCAMSVGLPMLLVARLLAGATAAAIIPLSMAWIGDVVAYDERQPVLAKFLIGQILGLSAGVLVGGLAADHFNWRLVFFGIAVSFVLISAGLFSINRRLPAWTTTGSAEQPRRNRGRLRHMASEFGKVLSKKWARVVLMTVFLEGALLYGPFAFIAIHVHRVHGISLSVASSLVMLFGVGGILFAVASKTFVSHLGEVGLAVGGGIILSAALITVGLAPAWWWAIPACFLAGLGFYMLHNTLQINATQMAPERRGAAVASFASCFFLGQSLGVGLNGALIERLGTSAVIAADGFAILLVALIFGRLRFRRLKHE